MKIFKKLATGFVSALLMATGVFQAAGATPGETTVGGFVFPESAIHDPLTDRYYVSNVGNAPGAPAAPGYISALKPNGQVINYKWIDGANASTTLNDPLGMAVLGGKLYVADIDYVRVFNVYTGANVATIHIPGVTGLNDVASYGLGVVVSDPGFDFATNTPTGTDAIYKISGLNNQVSTLASGTQLSNPNGLYYDMFQGLLVAPMTSPTIRLVNITSGQVSNFATLPAVGYDGIARVGSSFYFTNPPMGNVYKTGLNGSNPTLLANYPAFPADMNADQSRGRLLIPQLLGGSVIIKQL